MTAVRSEHVLCPYCARDIAAVDFSPWTARPSLLSAGCRCGRTVTMAAVTLRRHAADVDQPVSTAQNEEYDLALARLEWAKAAECADLPSQREALEWHVGSCESARSAVDDEPAAGAAT